METAPKPPTNAHRCAENLPLAASLAYLGITEKRDVCQMWHASRFLNILWHGLQSKQYNFTD